jgi:hypothetical protein
MDDYNNRVAKCCCIKDTINFHLSEDYKSKQLYNCCGGALGYKSIGYDEGMTVAVAIGPLYCCCGAPPFLISAGVA